MNESILSTIKDMLDVDVDPEEDEIGEFDNILIININTVFSILNQMGVGTDEPFVITGYDETWDQFIGEATGIEMVKTYIYLKVKMMFDPPSGAQKEANENVIKELEYRLYVLEDFRKGAMNNES